MISRNHLLLLIYLILLASLQAGRDELLDAMSNYENQYEGVMNNVVNVKTAGYKSVATSVHSEGKKIKTNSATSFRPGIKIYTGDQYNAAIEGPGFFVVNSPSGFMLTRDGRFTIDKENKLVSLSGGYPIMSDAGEIAFSTDETGGIKFTITDTGMILQGDARVGRIMVVNTDTTKMENINGVFFRAKGELIPVDIPKIFQYYQEGSNVEITKELIRMPMITKKYDASSKALQILSRTRKTGLEMGRSQ